MDLHRLGALHSAGMGKPAKAVKMLEEGVSRGYLNVLSHVNIRKKSEKTWTGQIWRGGENL
jgi:hypothetical protein